MTVAIIKYNAGNTCSVSFALERLGVTPIVTDNPGLLRSADKIIFPGVGEASTAMQYLKERNLDKLIKNLQQPVLGICLGMQLMCNYSEENDTECLGIFNTSVKRFETGEVDINAKLLVQKEDKDTTARPPSPFGEGLGVRSGVRLKVPHIGWNKVVDTGQTLFNKILYNPYCYFVHSYYAELCAQTTGTTEYGIEFCAALEKDNFYGVQFHPEKSATIGEQVLQNFLNI